MFDTVRLRLTFIYILAALVLVVGIGAGVYGLLAYYFQSSTDLSIRYRAALELRLRNATLPPALLQAEREYATTPGFIPTPTRINREHDDDDHENQSGEPSPFQPELAAIVVLPLTSDGQLVPVAGTTTPRLSPDPAAAQAAAQRGSDARTITSQGGAQIRMLSYRIEGWPGVEVLQVGRVLSDQAEVLRGLLINLVFLAMAATGLVGAASWWMAGRSLQPARLAWERQQTFIANASHELRTPVTLIRASTEVALRNTPHGDTDQHELLGDVLQECDHMGQLVDDLLLLSRLDSGRLKLELKAVDLAELLTDIARQVGRAAEQRGIQIHVTGTNGQVQADPTRLRQILLILLDNAIRHTPAGGQITMHSQATGSINITDTGSGIAPEHLPHLFERFYRVDAARGGDGGVGLGLAIARALIEAQHGQISIHSTIGHGTSILVQLPAVS